MVGMENSNKHFKMVAKGGVLIALGSFIALILQFITTIIVIRFISKEEFGVISLALVIINVVVTISQLGINAGLPRILVNKDSKALGVGQLIGSALSIILVASAVSMIVFWLFGNVIGNIFNNEKLSLVILLVMTLILPLGLMSMLDSIFRGLNNAGAKVIFQDIMVNFLRLVVVLAVSTVGLGYLSVVSAYLIAAWTGLIAYLAYSFLQLTKKYRIRVSVKASSEMIRFSFPLLLVALTVNITNWAGVLFIGYYWPETEVALYTVPLKLAGLFALPLAAIAYLYLPIVTQLFNKKNRLQDVRDLYVSSTKWTVIVTLPAFIFVQIYADEISLFLFGSNYSDVGYILRLLSAAYALHAFFGPNAMTLLAYGDRKSVVVGTFIAALFTIILAFLLIPKYGAVGAAFASVFAQACSNGYISIKLYRCHKIQPFCAEYTKPVLFILVLGMPAYLAKYFISDDSVVLIVITFLILFSVSLFSPIITRTTTNTDLSVYAGFEKRLFGRTNWFKSVGLQSKK